jgi:hypothetical protein
MGLGYPEAGVPGEKMSALEDPQSSLYVVDGQRHRIPGRQA